MRRLHLGYLGFICCGIWPILGACNDEADALVDDDAIREVLVTLHVGQAPMDGTTEMRAVEPLLPDEENLIYDLWLMQYVHVGQYAQLATDKVQHLRVSASGLNQVSNLEQVSLLSLESTILVIANHDYGNTSIRYPNIFGEGITLESHPYLTDLQSQLVTLDLAAINAGEVDKVLMCGYWKGTPTDSQTLNIQLGRMLARLNVTITNNTGQDFTAAIPDGTTDEEGNTLEPKEDTRLTVRVVNAAQQTSLYPSVNAAALPETAYTELEDKEVSLAAGASTTLYYYTAPNFCYSAAYATKILIADNNNSQASVVLGTDAPGTTNRDYNLYHNTIYNCTITLTP